MERSLLPVLLLCGVVSAQQPSPEVTDLLSVESSRSRFDGALLVLRAELFGAGGTRHVVVGEGQLGPREEDRLAPAQPFFTPSTLPDVVAAMRGGLDGGLELVRIGERTLVRAPEIEQVEAALRELRLALPPRLACSFRIERITEGAPVVLLSGVEAFHNGETVVVGDVERTASVVDVEVELAQASVSGNPVEVELRHGASAMLRARSLPGRDAAVVEAVLRVGVPIDAPPVPGSSDLGALNRISTRFEEAGLAFRVARGVESRHEWTALDGSRVAFVCRVDWQPAPAATVGAWVTPLLRTPVLGFRSMRSPERRAAEEQLPVAELAAAALRAGDDGGDDEVALLAAGDGGGVLVLRGEGGQRVARDLERRVDEALAACAVELEVFDVPAGAGPGVEGARLLWRCSGPAVAGLPSCFATGRERSYVSDWDVEVAQGARIADPKISLSEDGWFATVKPLPSVAGQPQRVELAVERMDFVALHTLELGLAGEMVAATESGRFALARQVVQIERPVTRQSSLGGTFELDRDGVAVLRRAAARLLGPGRELMVRVRVR